MQTFLSSAQEVVKRFSTDAARGLDSSRVPEMRRAHGSNTFTKEDAEPVWLRIWHAATEPMILMLIAAGLIALAVNVFRLVTGRDADFFEVIGVFVAISLSVVITVVMEDRSQKAFEALNAISENAQVKVVRDGHAVMIPQSEIVCGDLLSLACGDRVPADGRLVESRDLTADESALTGESVPAKKDAQARLTDPETPVAEQANMLFSGTSIASGFGSMIVTSVGDATQFGAIARELSRTDNGSTPLQEKLARLGKLITVLGIIAAAIVFGCEVASYALAGTLEIEHVMEAFVTSIVLIVAAVPEGLPTIVAVSLSLSVIKLSRENALVKKMIAAETIGCVNVICSDKTGTLTENKMTVLECWLPRACGNEPLTRVEAAQIDDERLLANFCINGTADIAEDGSFIGNPTEGALLVAADAAGRSYTEAREDAETLQVIPFSSEEKHMTTIVREGAGAVAYVKGSPERVLAMCEMDPQLRTAVEHAIHAGEDKAYRVLAFAHKRFDEAAQATHESAEQSMTFDGFVCISDPLRPDVFDAVQECRRAGVELKMLTGDNLVTATAIARELGMLDSGKRAVDARDIQHMDDAELSRELPGIAVIARSTPVVKMRVVKLLKAAGEVVAVTGDGINDAPALKNADVGIAMGVSGTGVAKEASDIVLLDDAFSAIVNAIRWGRGIYENFKRFISFQLTVNIASVITVFVSILLGFDAPFTALQLLWVNIIMDGPPALTLGLEPSYSDLMKQKPVRRDENIVDRVLLARIIVTGVYISCVFLAQHVWNFLGAAPEQASTVLFTLFTLFQLFNAFNCRELHTESIFRHILGNRLMLGVVGGTFVLQILIIQFAGAFFGTVPLPLDMWAKIFACSFSVIVLSELVRLVMRTAKGKKE